MKVEIAEQWANLLRSGKYAQGKNYLGKDNTYCCLGVLCELAVEQGIATKEVDEYGFTRYSDLTGDDLSISSLPVAVQEWADMETGDGLFTDRAIDGHYSLVSMNDSMNGKTFSEIADVIMDNVEKL